MYRLQHPTINLSYIIDCLDRKQEERDGEKILIWLHHMLTGIHPTLLSLVKRCITVVIHMVVALLFCVFLSSPICCPTYDFSV